MTRSVRLAAGALCVALAASHAPLAHAQSLRDAFRSALGAPGTPAPAAPSPGAPAGRPSAAGWAWTDTGFNPPVLEGATHLRIGYSAITGPQSRDRRLAMAARGRHTCDLNYLFHAKAGTFPEPRELEHCVRLELAILEDRGAPRRSLTDSFERADTIRELTPWIRARIDAFAKATRFYFRPENQQLEPFDMAQGAFNGFVHFGAMQAGISRQYEVFDYGVIGKGMAPNQLDYLATFGLPEQMARDLERSRNAGLLDTARGVLSFTLDRVSTGRVRDVPDLRIYHVRDVTWDLPYFVPNGGGGILEIK